MAKLVPLHNPLQTILKWAAQFKALTFADNMQTEVMLSEKLEGDILTYSKTDKLFKNGIRLKPWTPEPMGGVSYAVTQTLQNSYVQIGNLTIGFLYITGTTSGGAGNIIYIKAPTLPTSDGLIVNFARVRDAAAGNSVDGLMLPYTTFGGTLGFYKTDLTNWTNGTGRILVSTFIYENV